MVEKSEKEQGNRNDKEEGEDRGGGLQQRWGRGFSLFTRDMMFEIEGVVK